jgi:hypothetical protein
MTGGEISGKFYGGIYGPNIGTIVMTGGKISNNAITSSRGGGGVYAANFTMYDGEISYNTSDTSGGVYAVNFTMYGGEISYNEHNYNGAVGGGGVYAVNFTMHGGEISHNHSHTHGGGVYVEDNFTMTNGKISNNSAYFLGYTGEGGGVYLGTVSSRRRMFTMTGGEISGNSAFRGGGVAFHARPQIIFNKTGGVIYGYESEDPVNSNTLLDVFTGIPTGGVGEGHAVIVTNYQSSWYLKETTAGPEDQLFYDSDTGDYSGWDLTVFR